MPVRKLKETPVQCAFVFSRVYDDSASEKIELRMCTAQTYSRYKRPADKRSKKDRRVNAANKECRVYLLDPRPDAVALYSGCTPGKRRAWFLPDDRDTASLVGLRGGWRHARTKLYTRIYGSNAAVPG
ncbi:uncharacterized protein TNCV_5123701 [Trichonephila clavipes]|nr:uncharacterized protein TNCV_5123701 [Trichonephila clavipes]